MQGQADRGDRRETWAGDGTGGDEGAFTKDIRPCWGVLDGRMAEGEADTFSKAGEGGVFRGVVCGVFRALRDWCR